MSTTRETTLFCDVCANWLRTIGNAKVARRYAAQHGWKRQKGKDVCDHCVEKEKSNVSDK